MHYAVELFDLVAGFIAIEEQDYGLGLRLTSNHLLANVTGIVSCKI